MLDAGYKANVIPTEATAQVDGRFLPGFEDEFFATLAELVGDGVEVDYLSNQNALGDAVRRRAGRRDAPLAAGRGPRRPRGAVPDERRHRRQALPQARHALATASPRCGCPPTSTSPRCSTASTSGCRSTRWSSGRGCSTGSSTRSERRRSEVSASRRSLLPDDLAAQHHPAGAVGLDLHPVELPAAVLGAVDEQPGDDAAGELARDHQLVELPLHPRRGAGAGSVGWASSLPGHVVEGGDDLGGQGQLLGGQRGLQLGGGAGPHDRER